MLLSLILSEFVNPFDRTWNTDCMTRLNYEDPRSIGFEDLDEFYHFIQAIIYFTKCPIFQDLKKSSKFNLVILSTSF